MTIYLSFAQRIYDHPLFKYEYGMDLQDEAIVNAPHMLLKLSNDRCQMTISIWDYQFDEDVSIWDDVFVERYNAMDDGSEKVSIKKELAYLKTGKRRCLKMLSNLPDGVKVCDFAFIKDGHLILFAVAEPGSYVSGSKTPYADKLLSSLSLK